MPTGEIAPAKLGHTRFHDSDDEESSAGGSGEGCGGGAGGGAGGPGREGGLVLKEGDWTVDKKAASLIGTVLGRGKSARDPVEVDEDDWGEEADGVEDAADVLDLRAEPFDMYAKLRMPRESKDPRSKSRSCYHRLTARWHPRGFRSRPIVCDGCGARLTVGPDWFHKKGSENYDVCKACRPPSGATSGQAQGEGDQEEVFVAVESLDVLGEDMGQYERELERMKARDEAIVEFAKVGLPAARPRLLLALQSPAAAPSSCSTHEPGKKTEKKMIVILIVIAMMMLVGRGVRRTRSTS